MQDKIKEILPNIDAIPYQKCPKCDGQGMLSKPPYIAGDVHQWSASECAFTCDVCNGSKIIPMFSVNHKPTLTDAEIGWIDVNDRLPEFETDVLLFDNWKSRDGKQMKDIRVGYLSEYTKLKSSNGEVVSCEWKGTEFAFNITHWMPLPPTPTA